MCNEEKPGNGAGLLAELRGSLELSLGALGDKLTGAQRELGRSMASAMTKATPVFYRPVANGVVASTALVLDLGGPPAGTFWYIRRWTVSGVSPATVAAGVANLFITTNNNTRRVLADFGAVEWADQLPTMPNIMNYGDEEMPVHRGERVLVVISGATNGQELISTLGITAHQTGPVNESWSL